MMGASEMAIVLTMVLGGSFGVPLGMPPQPEDTQLHAIAPADCLYYTAWAGLAKPSGDSKNANGKTVGRTTASTGGRLYTDDGPASLGTESRPRATQPE